MEVSEKIWCEMSDEIIAKIVEDEECGQAKEYDNVTYIVLTNPIKLYNSYKGLQEFSIVGFVDQEDPQIMVGNTTGYEDKPYFEDAECYSNGILNIYAQLCGLVVCDKYKC